ncbi:MAG: class II aldolase/adducin family protein, partial [Desulfobacterales bacterium]|nr:class II aldolase/adducin family protein [Desulfobacterales bacterium]
YASAFAVLGNEIPTILAEMASVVGGSVLVTPYCRPGSPMLAKEVVKNLRDRSGVLLGNHGVVAIGSTIDEAFNAAQVIEDGARIYQMAATMGQPRLVPEEEVRVLREQYIKHYGQK